MAHVSISVGPISHDANGSAAGASAAAAERERLGANLRRLMVRFNLKLADVVAGTGLDERTVRSILRGVARPHAQTIYKLSVGLGVDADELFRDCQAASADFDRAANPAVAQLIDARPDLFASWTPAEYEELYSRVAVGGQLTGEGATAAAEAMNRRRELLKQVALVFESDQAELLEEYVALLYRRATAPFAEENSAPTAPGSFTTLRPPQADIRPGIYAGSTGPEQHH